MKKLIIVACMLAMANTVVQGQQNTLVNQYMFAGIILNPAYAGTHSYKEVQMLYRNQWVGVQNAPETNYITMHGPWKGKNKNIGTGLAVQLDRIGTSTQTEISGMYSYKIRLGPGKLAFGIRGGLFFFNSKLSEEKVFDEQDPVFINGNNNEFFVNFGSGLYYYTDKYYAGLSSQRLMTYGSESGLIDNSDNKQFSDKVTFIYGGYVFNLNENLKLKPNMLIKTSRATDLAIDINANLLVKDAFWIGLSHKVNQGWAALFQLEILDPLRFGYAYDIRSSNTTGGVLGSHEIMVSYDFGKAKLVMSDIKLF
jgi:type IX secretion system PorP/SprF family membrane protein